MSIGGLSRAIFMRFSITMVVFTAAMGAASLMAVWFTTLFVWYEGDPLYEFLIIIRGMSPLLLIVCWLIGFCIIFYLYWRKTLGYIDLIASASHVLITADEGIIELPPELKLVEDRMNKAKLEALRSARLVKDAEQRKNDLIVYLAHDLKTPLTSVIGYLTLLRDEGQISEELRHKYLSISLDKAERLEELINEFFEITRFNMSRMNLDISRVNLTRMLEQICSEFEPLLAEKGLQCRLEAEPDLEVKCDINKMERVFDNLIRNACSYSFDNSTIRILALGQEDEIVLHFINRGQTIPPEKMDRIFEQFFRLDTSRASRTGGAGLGLAIAREIILLHGGSIQASSADELIEFTLTLPLESRVRKS